MEQNDRQRNGSPDREEDVEVSQYMTMQNIEVEVRQAFEFVFSVEERFSQEPDKMQRFIDILDDYERTRHLPLALQVTKYDVFEQFKVLFEEHQDLLEIFRTQFMSESTLTTPPVLSTSRYSSE